MEQDELQVVWLPWFLRGHIPLQGSSINKLESYKEHKTRNIPSLLTNQLQWKETSNQTTEEEYRHVQLLKVIHVHHDLRKMFITLVWNDQQSFYPTVS